MDKTVIKAFRLVEYLATSEQPMGVTELAKALDLGKSNVHRLLQTLRELGYVRSADDGTYEVTLRLWEMGSYAYLRLDLRDIARPYMQALSMFTNETTHLSQLEGFEVLYIDKCDGREPVRAYTQLGGRAPAYCTATGKAMLAYQPRQRIAELFTTVRRFTPATIVDLDRFIEEVAQIRRQRCAINRGEWRQDIMGLASPIVGAAGEVTGAIGISGPIARLGAIDLADITERLVADAANISRALGCPQRAWDSLGKEDTSSAATIGAPTTATGQS